MFHNVVTVMAGLCLMFSSRGLCCAAEQTAFVDPQQGDYIAVTQLVDAIGVLKGKLAKSPSTYSTLISEESVSRAIKTSLRGRERGYEKMVRDARDDNARRHAQLWAQHFRKVVKPIYEEILQKQAWPSRAFFLCSEGPEFSSLSVQLHVETKHTDGSPYEVVPGLKITGHALPILKVKFGDDGPAADSGELHLHASNDYLKPDK